MKKSVLTALAVGVVLGVTTTCAVSAGQARWLSEPVRIAAAAQPLKPGAQALVAHRPMGFAASWRCGAQVVELGLVGNNARLKVAGRVLDLPPAVSASGARFASRDARFEAWSKGDRLMVTLDGKKLPECLPAIPDDLLPLKARGQEPGWSLTLTAQQASLNLPGAAPVVQPLPSPQVRSDALKFALQDGTDVVLRNAICHDTMTGMPYPYGVIVSQKSRRLLGCAGEPLQLLTGGSWHVQQVGHTAVPQGVDVSLLFDKSGQVSGRAGCNRYFGPFKLDGEGLRLGPLGATMMACAPDLDILERQMLKALAEVVRFDVRDDGTLTLHTVNGDTVLAKH